MKRITSWLYENILFIETLFLLLFIPLYPKIPLVDIKNTWVYIRLEDFVVLFAFITLGVLLFQKKVTLKTPLTIPILVYWLIGAIATIHAVLLIFPYIANVFPNISFLSLIRHIEYVGIFFVAFLGMKGRKLTYFIATLFLTLLGVIFYGFGQKFLNFPAFLTMNEEFAKGVPIHLSELGRVPSTFAGHYDLAAYLVLVIPIFLSLAIFGFKNWIIKIGLFVASFLGVILLFMTVSRVSFFVLFVSFFLLLFFQRKKYVLFAVPLILIFGVALVVLQPTLLDRFKGTVSEVSVLVDAKTGDSIGHVKYVSSDYFTDKVVLRRRVRDASDLSYVLKGRDISSENEELEIEESVIYPNELIPEDAPLVTAVNISTGENLPSGTGYVNLTLSPVDRRLKNFFYELPPNVTAESSVSAQVLVIQGDFIVKNAEAYDLSFTTRFQGEWPNAIQAFQRNILVGSGYGSVSLAVDNNYLRMLAETGILGLISFLTIFLGVGIYIKKTLPDLDRTSKAFVLGYSAGVVGLFLNAVLIDVFEASKVAFTLWLLTGAVMSVLVVKRDDINLLQEIKKALLSTYAMIIYLFVFTIVLFSPLLGNYFVGDDFTWLRWVADCTQNCSPLSRISSYFTQSSGFFFRPGTKVYFDLMYNFFWLNPVVYHGFSIFLHFAASALVFLLAGKIVKNKYTAFAVSVLFLIFSGHLETVFWISATGHLVNAVFGLLAVLLFIFWEEKRKLYYLFGSFLSIGFALLFHELGVVLPLLIVGYKLKGSTKEALSLFKRWDFLILFLPVILYLMLRFMSQSHWFSGDYSYNPVMLPFNFVGNLIGYSLVTILGPMVFSSYSLLRNMLSSNILLAFALIPFLILVLYLLQKIVRRYFTKDEKGLLVFGASFFVISLLPFLGLGNITLRYNYLAAFGVAIILVVFARKFYEYLSGSGRSIAIGVFSLLCSIFILFHLMQAQQVHSDWYEASKKTQNFFKSIDTQYRSWWSEDDIRFHFVNVPIKHGEAWIFPVGLDDAVWFAFKNENARVFTHKELTDLPLSEYTYKDIILIFNEDGSVSQHHFTKEPLD